MSSKYDWVMFYGDRWITLVFLCNLSLYFCKSFFASRGLFWKRGKGIHGSHGIVKRLIFADGIMWHNEFHNRGHSYKKLKLQLLAQRAHTCVLLWKTEKSLNYHCVCNLGHQPWLHFDKDGILQRNICWKT